MTPIFVYGTLKKGHGNNRVITEHPHEFVGEAVTNDKFFLYDGGFPRMSKSAKPVAALSANQVYGRKAPVKGEVWLVDEAGLLACDRLEGHPTFYNREKIGVKITSMPRPQFMTPWAYLIVGVPNGAPASPQKGILQWPTRK